MYDKPRIRNYRTIPHSDGVCRAVNRRLRDLTPRSKRAARKSGVSRHPKAAWRALLQKCAWGAKTIHLPDSSADTLDLINAARRGARAVFREGYAYAKAGIIMDDLIPAGNGTRPLSDARDREK